VNRERALSVKPKGRILLLAGLIALGLITFALVSDGGAEQHAWSSVLPARPPPRSIPAETDSGGLLVGLQLTLVAEGLEEPVAAVGQAGTDRLFVLERRGTIRLLDRGRLVPRPVVDLTDRVSVEGSLERGLVGMALHPAFDANGRVFLSYTDATTDLVIAEFRAMPDRATFGADPIAELLRVEQPGLYHHGGTMHFGPDGYLWLGLGDGGGRGGPDPRWYGQNPATLQGTLVRIDVDTTGRDADGNTLAYAVPGGNPFVSGDGGAPEVWAFGLRNPWGFTFDEGLLYVADVGAEQWEEINVVSIERSAGANFGWSVFEGPECMQELLCDLPDTVDPVVAVPREGSCAIIGGPVYRGEAIPELSGRYFYGDYCFGWIRTLWFSGGRVVEHFDWSGQIAVENGLTNFAVDGHGEIYVLRLEGQVYRIDPVRRGDGIG
jgi:glucose/arabinose dehydrogenase